MTDDDRMDRAKRIREMREGSRDEDNAADEPAAKQAMEDPAESAAGAEEANETAEPTDDSEDSEPSETNPEMTSTDQPDTDDSGAEQSPAESNGEEVSAPLPDTDTLEQALEDDESSEEVETAAPEMADDEVPAPGEEATQQAETRVLEFRLDDEHYCLDIEYIEEIVKEETITRVPNTPEYVQGVVDLRGQITTILNPKVTLDKGRTDADQLIVVFDSEAFEDQGHIGWVVDDVRQVSPIAESEVNDPPVEEEHINGVIDREDDDQFVIWTSPELALEEAET